MTKEELENYFVESAGYGRDKVINFMDIVNKALEQKGERITELERKLEQTEKDLADYQFNYPTIKELQKENTELTDELKALRESVKNYGAGCYENGLRNGKRKLEEQLTKAKKIIQRLVTKLYKYTRFTDDVLAEAEQFLSEVEK